MHIILIVAVLGIVGFLIYSKLGTTPNVDPNISGFDPMGMLVDPGNAQYIACGIMAFLVMIFWQKQKVLSIIILTATIAIMLWSVTH